MATKQRQSVRVVPEGVRKGIVQGLGAIPDILRYVPIGAQMQPALATVVIQLSHFYLSLSSSVALYNGR